MDSYEFISNNKNLSVSITAYRTLLVLKLLLEKGRTLEEIVRILKEDPVTSMSCSKDTARITLITLKAAGCKISRPARSNDFKYELIYNPFSLILTDEEMVLLLRLRDNLEDKVTWKDIITVNSLYNKITRLTDNQDQIDLVNMTKSLGNVKPEVIAAFFNDNILNKKVLLEYNSPEFGCEDIYIVPYKIIYENRRLYVLNYSFKYESNCYLELSRISRIKSVNNKEKYPAASSFYVIYRLFGNAMDNYEKQEYETVLAKTNSYMDVKANVNNEFSFIQRLLLYGIDFKILEPSFFREKIIDKIKLIQRNYDPW